MLKKTKICNQCNEERQIWKRHENKVYCKSCWNEIKSTVSKKTVVKKSLKKKSTKLEKLEALYSILRKIFLEQHPFCKAKLPGCTISATDIHHKAGRGNYLLDTSTFLPVCRTCHNIIETNPEMARKLELSLSKEQMNNGKNKGSDSKGSL